MTRFNMALQNSKVQLVPTTKNFCGIYNSRANSKIGYYKATNTFFNNDTTYVKISIQNIWFKPKNIESTKRPLIKQESVLRKKCPYSELFWSAFSGIRTEYGEIRNIFPYSVWMRENTDQVLAMPGFLLATTGWKTSQLHLNITTND